MTRMWIVVGDSTSSGGQVVTGSAFTDIDGKPVARVTDQATCPAHSGTFPIVDGDTTTLVDGQPVALHGSKLACGCAVLAVQQVRVALQPAAGIGASAVAAVAAVMGGAGRIAPADLTDVGTARQRPQGGRRVPYRLHPYPSLCGRRCGTQSGVCL